MLHSHSLPAPAPLARHVECVWRLTGQAEKDLRVPILPDVAGADVVLQLGEPGRLVEEGQVRPLPERFVVGGLGRALLLEPVGAVDVLGIHLPPACACLLGTSAAALRERVLPLAQVAPGLDAALAEWARQRPGGEVALEGLWPLLSEHLRPCCDALVCEASRTLAGADSPPVAELAETLGVSRRQLTRRFQDAVGVPPRDFVRFARMARAWRGAATTPDRKLAELAAEAGYADQPHLDRDFRELAGAPPSRALGKGQRVVATVEEEAPSAVSPPYKSRPPSRG
ncbi:AraC family transcriptional regulator [Archangium violaceum]|uniref:AraC family transcriptional regulator n=1 Tax=Archangium violaceum TaxID=83451 RepID=UPI002B2894C4|nr:AraC family transcriptional regulator [Archangium violaceum]